jgi:hypothetical protein
VTDAVEKRRAFAGIRIRAEKCRDAVQLVGSRSHQAVPSGIWRKTRVMTRASALPRCPQCGCAQGTGRGSLRSNELPLAESARLMPVTHCPARPSGARSRPISREPAAARQENASTPAPAAEPIGRLRQPLSGQPLRQRCASSLRGAPVVTTRPKPRPASDCGVQAQVTDPSDGLLAAAGNPGKPFAMHPPQAGCVHPAPDGPIDLAQPDEPAGLRPQQRVQPMSRLATASVIGAKAVPGRPATKKSAQEREWCPASASVPDSLRQSGRTETLT